MHSIRISTLSCLVLQISLSARYGHAADFQIISLKTPSGASSWTSLVSRNTIPRKERISDSLSVSNDDSDSMVMMPYGKKCSGGIKSRYCRSYHRNLKEDESASEVKADSVVVPEIATEKPKVEVKTHQVDAVIPKIEVETPIGKVTAQLPDPKLEVPATGGNQNQGDATYYGTGMGACGIVSNDHSMIAAASRLLFDTFPGATANPNLNPICGRKVRATYQGNSVDIEVVDRCEACAMHDLDFSPAAFAKLGAMEHGRLHGMTWEWI